MEGLLSALVAESASSAASGRGLMRFGLPPREGRAASGTSNSLGLLQSRARSLLSEEGLHPAMRLLRVGADGGVRSTSEAEARKLLKAPEKDGTQVPAAGSRSRENLLSDFAPDVGMLVAEKLLRRTSEVFAYVHKPESQALQWSQGEVISCGRVAAEAAGEDVMPQAAGSKQAKAAKAPASQEPQQQQRRSQQQQQSQPPPQLQQLRDQLLSERMQPPDAEEAEDQDDEELEDDTDGDEQEEEEEEEDEDPTLTWAGSPSLVELLNLEGAGAAASGGGGSRVTPYSLFEEARVREMAPIGLDPIEARSIAADDWASMGTSERLRWHLAAAGRAGSQEAGAPGRQLGRQAGDSHEQQQRQAVDALLGSVVGGAALPRTVGALGAADSGEGRGAPAARGAEASDAPRGAEVASAPLTPSPPPPPALPILSTAVAADEAVEAASPTSSSSDLLNGGSSLPQPSPPESSLPLESPPPEARKRPLSHGDASPDDFGLSSASSAAGGAVAAGAVVTGGGAEDDNPQKRQRVGF